MKTFSHSASAQTSRVFRAHSAGRRTTSAFSSGKCTWKYAAEMPRVRQTEDQFRVSGPSYYDAVCLCLRNRIVQGLLDFGAAWVTPQRIAHFCNTLLPLPQF